MFVILVKYIKPVDEVEAVLPAHLAYLDQYYAQGNFICSGRQVPRVGGVILCDASTPEEVEYIVQDDPFYQQHVAEYTITEFVPTKCAPGLEQILPSTV